MLVKSQYKTNDIICFRITTGEEIVAKLKIEDPHTYTVTKPLASLEKAPRQLADWPIAL